MYKIKYINCEINCQHIAKYFLVQTLFSLFYYKYSSLPKPIDTQQIVLQLNFSNI